MPQLDCPSPAELSAFSLGELAEAALEDVAAHLEQCPQCAAAVRSLDRVSDLVIDSLRSLAGDEDQPSLIAASLPMPSRVGEYEILDELGRGGMGVVYKARHAQLRRVVALKMLLGGEFARESYRARFRAEAEAVARLQHPNIVQIFDIGEWHTVSTGTPVAYFTLEYAEGGSLNTRLDGKPQPHGTSVELLLTLAWAVHYAHGQGVVHRDLKPSNVLLTADGQPKLCDFGVAKVLTGTGLETLAGVLVGTPEYMAPEQADGQALHVGPAADVYALGAILYTMLTGRPPFQSASVVETLAQVRFQEPVSPRRLRPSVPRDLETICLKCLQKDPRRRYSSASALADDLDRFQSKRPIFARPAGMWERAWKQARRRPTETILTSVIALVTLLGIGLVSWQWQRAESKASAEAVAKENAQRARQLAVQEQAQMALNQGLALCERGEVAHGLLWLARSLQLSTAARADHIDRAIRINTADWEDQLSRTRFQFRLSAPVSDLVFSRDGRTLICVGKDRFIQTWETATGKEARQPHTLSSPAQEPRIHRVSLSPADAHLMAAADDKGRILFWDLHERREVGEPLIHPAGRTVLDFTFSPDGQHLLTCCDDGSTRIWDVASRKQIGDALRHGEAVGHYTMALSPDGRTLVTGGEDRQATFWDLITKSRLDPIWLKDSPISTLAYCDNGRRILAGTWDGRLFACDSETRREFIMPLQGSGVSSLAVSPNDEIFATGTRGGVVRFWNAGMLGQTGQTLMLVRPVIRLAFHPHGTLLATGQDDGMVQLWELPRPRTIGRPFLLERPVQSIGFSPDGSKLKAASPREGRWWDLTSDQGGRVSWQNPAEGAGALEPRRSDGSAEMSETLSVGPDGRSLTLARWARVDGRTRGWIELHDTTTGNRIRQSPEQSTPFSGLIQSPDSQSLLTWESGTRSALLWDLATLRQARPILRSLDAPIHQAVFRNDGKVLLVACPDGSARLWDLTKDEEINPGLRPHHGYPLTAVAFDPTGQRVVTGCQDGTVGIWDVINGKLLVNMRGHSGEIAAVTFSPNGKTLLTASHDGSARFWDTESGIPLGPPLRHAEAVHCVAFHPNGQSIATGTRDGKVLRWLVPSPPEPGSVDEIRVRIEALTGSWLDYQGAVHTLSFEQRKARGL